MRQDEKLVFQRVWLKAWRSEAPLRIEFKTKTAMLRARMGLYNAVRQEEQGINQTGDLELMEAAQGIEICLAQGKEFALILRKRMEGEMFQGLLEALGEPGGTAGSDAIFSEEAAASEARLTEMLRGIPEAKPDRPEHQDNPYYGKRAAE